MASSTNLLRKIQSFSESPQFQEFTKVIIVLDDDGSYVEAGDETGRTLEISCPWGTEAMAESILSDLSGFRYAPYEASGAILDPSMELGDGVSVNGVYSGIYKQTLNFSRNATAGISAPQDEEIDHEIPYQSSTDRKFTRQVKGLRSELSITASEIRAEVADDVEGLRSLISVTASEIREEVSDEVSGLSSALSITADGMVAKTGGNNNTFGWSLQDTAFTLYSNGTNVFQANKDGITINGSGTFSGRVTATSGTIGGCTISNGVLEIENANIESVSASKLTSGTINATEVFLEASGRDKKGVYYAGGFGVGYGNDGKETTMGCVMYHGTDPDGASNYIIVTTAGARLQGGDTQVYASSSMARMQSAKSDTYVYAHSNTGNVGIYAKGYTIYMEAGTITQVDNSAAGSDRKIKNSISYDMEKYEQFFMGLKPAFFRVNHGTSGRFHTGFVAQDVYDALIANGLSTSDLAAYVKTEKPAEDENEEAEEMLALRYGEFVSLNTYMIQKALREIETIKSQLAQ